MSNIESGNLSSSLRFRVGGKLFIGGSAIMASSADIAVLHGPYKVSLFSGAVLALGGLACMTTFLRGIAPTPPPPPPPPPPGGGESLPVSVLPTPLAETWHEDGAGKEIQKAA